MPIVLKSENHNLLETSGPVQACHGIAVPSSRHFEALIIIYLVILNQSLKMASIKPKHVAMFC